MGDEEMGHQRPSLLSVAEAQERLLDHFVPLEAHQVPLTQAIGRVLACDVAAPFDLPIFPNSSMDGFAVRAVDCQFASPDAPVNLWVVGDIPAGGVPDMMVYSGQAARIMTGAVLPAGADAVIPVEKTNFNARQAGKEAPTSVLVYHAIRAGANVRTVGEDVHQGEVVLHAGQCLRPQDIGLLGMLGLAQVWVHRRPRIAIFSTGDELLPVDMPLSGGKIHDSNSYTLVALAEQYGAEAVYLGIVPDQAQAVEDCLERARQTGVDLIVSSAGVSVGAFDFVRDVVEQNGSLDFWRVNMRPGKPLAFGHYQNILFVGLPGNPVSSFVCFEVFVRPALLKLLGLTRLDRFQYLVRLLENVESDGRESYLRAVVSRQDGALAAVLTGHQGSGNLRSLVQANALLIVPAGVKSLPAGSQVNAWLFEEV